MAHAKASTRRATTTGLVRQMVVHAKQLRSRLAQRGGREIKQAAKSLADSLGRTVSTNEAADTIAQAAACAAPILAKQGMMRSTSLLDALEQGPSRWEQASLREARVLSTEYSVLPGTRGEHRHVYELFLRQYSTATRKRHGVFFTPQPIADYIAAGADRLVRDQFSLTDGLANKNVNILDPACGTGIFLLTVIDQLAPRGPIQDLLPRLIGVEILPAAALLAKLNIAMKLAERGYELCPTDHINILIADALSSTIQSKIQHPTSKIPVILGNPPFSSLSTNTNDWIARLVRGDDDIRGYVRANGQQLKERKTWLHDDYVKFIRLAQWHIEQAGAGIVSFVTNHGYLDNATFRLMRHELLRVFPHIEILDLHGNRKKHEVAPDGTRDENVFGLDQGVAIGLFCRPPCRAEETGKRRQGTSPMQHVRYCDLWGTAADKLHHLVEAGSRNSVPCPLSPVPFQPAAPDWSFIPTNSVVPHPEYDSAWSLAEAMPLHATAPVTARDHFVVSFSKEELAARIADFRNLSIPDAEIRRRYFQRTRSARYQRGDTRGWKLSDARHIVAADANWQRHIVRCLYRPFDWRFVFWHPAMIDWPRTEVTRHLVDTECGMKGNEAYSALRTPRSALCLIARRQQLPTQPCTFFWISDGLTLDGVIRSDNRGSESLFPLYVDGQANFAAGFIEQFNLAAGLHWLPFGRGDLRKLYGPEDVLAYIYAVFHSPTYRVRYADSLRRDFPRVLKPSNREEFMALCGLGHELIGLHLLRPPRSAFPVPLVTEAVANFRAGGYSALRKWLQPEHHSPQDPQYAQIASAVGRTVEIMSEIDAIASDDWP